jgi:hypothetical protein
VCVEKRFWGVPYQGTTLRLNVEPPYKKLGPNQNVSKEIENFETFGK